MGTDLTLAELEAAAEQDLGASDWHRVDQQQIDAFAEATGDRQWIHVDPERAKAGPFGGTVAHGYLTLSLLPSLLSQVLRITDMRTRINYGIDRLRFTAPVPSGSDVRVKARLLSSEPRGEGVLYKLGVEVEVRDQPRPALVGQVLYLVPR
jgi:acyl dehydratase